MKALGETRREQVFKKIDACESLPVLCSFINSYSLLLKFWGIQVPCAKLIEMLKPMQFNAQPLAAPSTPPLPQKAQNPLHLTATPDSSAVPQYNPAPSAPPSSLLLESEQSAVVVPPLDAPPANVTEYFSPAASTAYAVQPPEIPIAQPQPVFSVTGFLGQRLPNNQPAAVAPLYASSRADVSGTSVASNK
jgi:hypothetical protein